MALATYEDVAVAIGRPISDENEVEKVEQWLSDVEMLISARLGDIADLDPDVLTYVEREVVVARMRQDSASADTVEENYFVRSLVPWWVLLKPAGVLGGAFSIQTIDWTTYP